MVAEVCRTSVTFVSFFPLLLVWLVSLKLLMTKVRSTSFSGPTGPGVWLIQNGNHKHLPKECLWGGYWQKWSVFIVDGLTKWCFGVMSLGPNISEGSKAMGLEWDITPKYWKEPQYIQAFMALFSTTRMKEKSCLCGHLHWAQACSTQYFRWSF